MNNIEFARPDTHRPLRNGFSETIYCAGKTQEQVIAIVEKIVSCGQNVLGTRAEKDVGDAIAARFKNSDYDYTSRTFCVVQKDIKPLNGRLAILAAGTSDIKVAEEARRTAQFFGIEARTYYDVGVAGIHRILSHREELQEYDALIVVAGMEGALPSVVGGLVGRPIIAVPTSIGYGSNFNGITPLLAMLNSCSEGITVVNIDNGFGAACAALRIINNLATNDKR